MVGSIERFRRIANFLSTPGSSSMSRTFCYVDSYALEESKDFRKADKGSSKLTAAEQATFADF